jgi:glycosyltransferase involved in cell wall biosynthesis
MQEHPEKVVVGFVSHDGSWLGGRTYLMNLIRAIRCLPMDTLEPILLKGRSTPDPSPDFPGVTIISTSLLDERSFKWLCRQGIKAISRRDWLLERLLIDNRVDVLSHSGHLGRNSSVATIGWIPDFQSSHLPEFFTETDRASRNKWNAALGKQCDRVIVSSETVRQDMQQFLPQYAHKARVLRFVATAASEDQSTHFSSLQQKYGIPDRYFLLPNQFWAHKNHRVVLSALKILKQTDATIPVYTTGNTEDPRNPAFFRSLMDYAAECGVQDSFRILGVVPFADLAGLMRNTVAFINPSKFEGWSTSVEESKTLGKSVILSDIPVHREQSPRLGTYFPPDDAEALAKAMLSVWRSYDSDIDASNQARAHEEFPSRQLDFARTFQQIVLETRSGHRKET